MNYDELEQYGIDLMEVGDYIIVPNSHEIQTYAHNYCKTSRASGMFKISTKSINKHELKITRIS